MVVACVAILTAIAWAYLFHLDRQMSAAMAYEQSMAEMGMPMDAPWASTDVFFAFGMWTVMMVGMMAPSVAPVLLVVARSGASQTTPFGAGYFVVWTAFSAAAAIAQWLLHEAALLSPMMGASSAGIGGGILIGAGIYQWTPLKRACLVHCQNPVSFLMTHFRSGLAGAFRMGLHHGAYCLGCCWALMAVLFVVGIMNLLWVAALGAFVLVEKAGWAGKWFSAATGAGLIVAGAVLLLHS